MNGVLFLALAATFGIAWLRRKAQPTDWAKWPALGLAAVGVMSIVWSSGLQTWWPVIPLIAGVVLLVTGLRRKPTLSEERLAGQR